jgi:hypothetical protein
MLDWKKYFDTFVEVVIEIEDKWTGESGSKKKELAVEFINDKVDVPYLPEWAEAKVIALLIDLIVYMLNRTLGKSWGKDAVDTKV